MNYSWPNAICSKQRECDVHEPRRAEASSARPYVNFDIASFPAMHIIFQPDASMGGHCAATVEPSQRPSD
jgi:hypothetical protein